MEYMHDVMSDGNTRAHIFKEGKKYHVHFTKKNKKVGEETNLPSLKVAESRAIDWCLENADKDNDSPYTPVHREVE